MAQQLRKSNQAAFEGKNYLPAQLPARVCVNLGTTFLNTIHSSIFVYLSRLTSSFASCELFVRYAGVRFRQPQTDVAPYERVCAAWS